MSLIETLSIQAKDINLQLRIAQDTPAERDAALRRALQAGCRGLSSVLLDPMFRQLYEGSMGRRAELGDWSKLSIALAIKPPGSDPLPAVVAFVQQEKQLLRAVGWHAQDAELIGEKLLNLILTPSDRSENGAEAFKEIGRIRNLLCQLDPAPDLETPPQDGPPGQAHDWLSGLAHVATSLGGAAIVVVDASALALSHGLSAPLSELSKVAGGALFVDSGKAAWKALAHAPRSQCKCKEGGHQGK
jgi:hypothetical protein